MRETQARGNAAREQRLEDEATARKQLQERSDAARKQRLEDEAAARKELQERSDAAREQRLATEAAAAKVSLALISCGRGHLRPHLIAIAG